MIVKILDDSVVHQEQRKDWEGLLGDLDEGYLMQSGNSWLTHKYPQNRHLLLLGLDSL